MHKILFQGVSVKKLLIISYLISSLTIFTEIEEPKNLEPEIKVETKKDLETSSVNSEKSELEIKTEEISQKDLEHLAELLALNPLITGEALQVIKNVSKELVDKDLKGITSTDVTQKIVTDILSKKSAVAEVLKSDLSVETQKELLKLINTEAGKELFSKSTSISQKSSAIVIEALQEVIKELEKKQNKYFNLNFKLGSKKIKSDATSKEGLDKKPEDITKKLQRELEDIAEIIILNPLKNGAAYRVIEAIATEFIKDKKLKDITSKKIADKILENIFSKKDKLAELFKDLSNKALEELVKFTKTSAGIEWFEKVANISNATSMIVMDAMQNSVYALEKKYGVNTREFENKTPETKDCILEI